MVEDFLALLLIGLLIAWLARTLSGQQLARKRIDVRSSLLNAAQLNQLFVQQAGRGGRDGVDHYDSEIRVQPRHMRWNLRFEAQDLLDDAGGHVAVGTITNAQMFEVRFPVRRWPVGWRVIERWRSNAKRKRRFMKAVAKADPDAVIEARMGTYEYQ